MVTIVEPYPKPPVTVEEFERIQKVQTGLPAGTIITSYSWLGTAEGKQLTLEYQAPLSSMQKKSVAYSKAFYSKVGASEVKQLLVAGYEPVKGERGVYQAPPTYVEETPVLALYRARTEGLIPFQAEVTETKKTPEGYEFQYKMPTLETPKATPPKDVFEWLGRAGANITTQFRQTLFPTTKERVRQQWGYRESYTISMIKRLESTQEWLREAPIQKQLRFNPLTGRYTVEKPIVEPMAQALEYAYIPVGMVRTVEAPIYAVPSVASALMMGTVTVPNIEKGLVNWVKGVQKQPIMLITTFAPSQIAEHRGLLVGEIAGQYLMGKYVYGPTLGKAWTKIKTSFSEWAYPEKALYEKAVLSASIPDEEVFRWLTKTEKGWTYQAIKSTERLTTETGKKASWKPMLWEKPEGLKPTSYEWLPPEPMKATVLRELPKEFVTSSGKGLALVTKQVTKEISKVSLNQAVSPKFLLPTVAISALPKTVPSLVKYKGPTFPSMYKQAKEVMTVSMPKLASYPAEKSLVKLETVPKTLLLPSEKTLFKTVKVTKQPQMPKTVQLPKETQTFKQPQLAKQLEKQAQAMFQMQKQVLRQMQTQPPQYRFKFELPRIKRKLEGLRGEWFKREHPIATPEQVARSFGFSIGKSIGKRGKTKYGP